MAGVTGPFERLRARVPARTRVRKSGVPSIVRSRLPSNARPRAQPVVTELAAARGKKIGDLVDPALQVDGVTSGRARPELAMIGVASRWMDRRWILPKGTLKCAQIGGDARALPLCPLTGVSKIEPIRTRNTSRWAA